MERKKNTLATSENLRFSMALMGFLFVGGLLLASFTYETATQNDLIEVASIAKSRITYELKTEEPDDSQTREIKVTPPPAAKIKITPPIPTPPQPIVTPPLPPPIIIGPVIAPSPPPVICASNSIPAGFVPKR